MDIQFPDKKNKDMFIHALGLRIINMYTELYSRDSAVLESIRNNINISVERSNTYTQRCPLRVRVVLSMSGGIKISAVFSTLNNMEDFCEECHIKYMKEFCKQRYSMTDGTIYERFAKFRPQCKLKLNRDDIHDALRWSTAYAHQPVVRNSILGIAGTHA